MKKIIAVLISLSIWLSLAAPFSAWANEPYEIENPLYSSDGVTAPLKGGNILFMEESESAKYDGKTYYTKGRQIYLYAKDKLDKRKESFYIYLLYKDELNSLYAATNNVTQMVFLGATDDELSVNSTDGDYIRWAVKSLETTSITKVTKKNGYNYYKLKVGFSYYDTPAQEKKADSAVNSFINSLDTNGKTDVQIIKEVHDYLCKINTYDYAAAENPYSHLYAFSSYGALLKGKCVCQGYASAFYRICKELGYNVRFVGSDPDWGCHAWNIIELDGKFYIVDCTWDDQIFDDDELEIEPYYYFLTDYSSSREYDSIGEHKLYSGLYENNYFETNYKQYFAEKPYAKETGSRLSSCSVSLSQSTFTYNSSEVKPEVTVKDGSTVLNKGTDYTVTYSSNTDTGLARVDITGLGSYEGSSSHRLFTIIPQNTNSLKVSKVTANSVTLKWTKPAGSVSGYVVQSYYDGKWNNVAFVTTTSYKVTSLKPSKKQSFRVRAYKTVYKHNFYNASGNKVTCSTKPKKVKITSVKAGAKKLTVKWKKSAGTGYQIQYSINRNFENAKTVKAKSGALSKTVKKLKRNKRYYVRIRAYRTYKNENGKTKTVYSVWNAKKSVKIK